MGVCEINLQLVFNKIKNTTKSIIDIFTGIILVFSHLFTKEYERNDRIKTITWSSIFLMLLYMSVKIIISLFGLTGGMSAIIILLSFVPASVLILFIINSVIE